MFERFQRDVPEAAHCFEMFDHFFQSFPAIWGQFIDAFATAFLCMDQARAREQASVLADCGPAD
jgi:hypothetical protein